MSWDNIIIAIFASCIVALVVGLLVVIAVEITGGDTIEPKCYREYSVGVWKGADNDDGISVRMTEAEYTRHCVEGWSNTQGE